MRSSLVLLCLFAIAACAPQRLAVPEPAQALKSELVFYDYRNPAAAPEPFTIRFDDGSGERTTGPADLRPREFGFPSSPVYRTRSGGTLHVKVDYATKGQSASGSVDLPLKPDWVWGVSLHVTAGNPLEGCMGCMGVRSFPIAGAEGPNAPKLHIVWGGNSISQPAVY